MKNTALFDETNRATYCPEDDKLRLYVGRVPRDEYEALRAEGWTSTPKQDCDFVAVWTPTREDTAESYAGIIEDEDAGPDERAADRAERFSGYLESRLSEAVGHADRFDAGPAVHGFQSKARAARAADRHDRIASRAVNAWEKADYWQTRTAGVISHALHLQSPSVRMGRIKTIEADLRKAEKDLSEWASTYRFAENLLSDPEPFIADIAARYEDGDELEAARRIAETALSAWGKTFTHPRDTERTGSLRSLMDPEKPDPMTLSEAAAAWLAIYKKPGEDNRTIRHLRLRLAYENQMIEAQGGRAASLEMAKGGTLGGRVIAKVNKSTATGRVVSVAVIGPRVEGWAYQVANEPGTEFALYTIKTERLAPGSYTEPTPESLAKLAEFETARKAAAAAHKAKTPPCPLVNPTLEDAERLQSLLNAENEKCPWRQRNNDAPQSSILLLTQAEYSQISGGSYARAETTEICAMGARPERSNLYSTAKTEHNRRIGPVLCKVRTASPGNYAARRVIHITDKPAKPIPAAVWQAYTAPAEAPATVPA